MTDIVERLRDPSAFPDTIKADCAEAADEIERLRRIEAAYNNLVQAENDLLRAKARIARGLYEPSALDNA